jgi:hypothetical protein
MLGYEKYKAGKLTPVDFFGKRYYWAHPANGKLALLPLGVKVQEYWSCCGVPKTV